MEAVPALEMVIAAIGGIALTIGGLAIELFAVSQLLIGEFIIGGWLVAVGAIALLGGARLLDEGLLKAYRRSG